MVMLFTAGHRDSIVILAMHILITPPLSSLSAFESVFTRDPTYHTSRDAEHGLFVSPTDLRPSLSLSFSLSHYAGLGKGRCAISNEDADARMRIAMNRVIFNLRRCGNARVSRELQIINRGKMMQGARKLVYIRNVTSFYASIANEDEPDVPRERRTPIALRLIIR